MSKHNNNLNHHETFSVNFKSLFGLFLILLAWQILSTLFLPKATTEASDLTIDNILSQVNKERTLRNLNSLNTDSRLSFAAAFKANDMMNRRYFSHTDPEGNYIWNKIVEAGYTPYLQLGENLAIEFYNTESLVSAWMNSLTHRANILNENFKDQGMGVAFGTPSEGQYYSSTANTFGALVPLKKTRLPTTEETSAPTAPSLSATVSQLEETKSASSPATQPEPLNPQQSVVQSEISTTSEPTRSNPKDNVKPNRTKGQPAESLRTSMDSESDRAAQDYALPQEHGQSENELTTTPAAVAVINIPKTTGLTAYQINRYLMLGLGGILVLMLASDLKKMLETKFQAYDKKINNLVLLILSLIVIGLMYWL